MKKTPSPVLGSTELITLTALLREVIADEREGGIRAVRNSTRPDGGRGVRTPTAPEPPASCRLPETCPRFDITARHDHEAVA